MRDAALRLCVRVCERAAHALTMLRDAITVPYGACFAPCARCRADAVMLRY